MYHGHGQKSYILYFPVYLGVVVFSVSGEHVLVPAENVSVMREHGAPLLGRGDIGRLSSVGLETKGCRHGLASSKLLQSRHLSILMREIKILTIYF